MANTIKAVYIKPDGTLLLKESTYDNLASLRAPFPLVGAWFFWESGDPPQPFAEEYSGNSAYSFFETDEGVGANAFDVTPEKARQKLMKTAGGSTTFRDLPAKTSSADALGRPASSRTLTVDDSSPAGAMLMVTSAPPVIRARMKAFAVSMP